jgi:hypothetical protein
MKVPNEFRVRIGSIGNNGCFFIPRRPGEPPLRVICGEGLGWQHVSVSLPDRCPTWAEMCRIKGLFWGPEDVVMQLHPRESEYVNDHPYCLHLWRPLEGEIPSPPSWMVGGKAPPIQEEYKILKKKHDGPCWRNSHADCGC